MKVLCIGSITYDMSFMTNEYPKENIKYRFDKRVDCGGGQASNVAYLLSKWGIDTYMAGVVGNDDFGRKIISEFTDIGVDTTNVEINDNTDTRISFIIINTSNGKRTVFSYSEPNSTMNNKNIKLDVDYVLVDGQHNETAINFLNDNMGVVSIMDADRVTTENIKLAKMVDYLVTSKGFAEQYTNITIDTSDVNTLINAYKKLKEDFEGEIVITLEDKGCIYEEKGEIKIMPAYSCKAVDTTGAGDIFHGAFVYGLMCGYSYEDVIRISNIAGGLSVRKVGSRYSIPHIKEVLNVYDKTK
ncbi:MAG: carbohydrate kinase family protein [bacterium]|nr:carbohydrate kinase family protein [bacterium]